MSDTFDFEPDPSDFDEPNEWDEGGGYYAMCRYCGAGFLKWRHTTKGWRLFYEGYLHDCRGAPASPDDFDVVED